MLEAEARNGVGRRGAKLRGASLVIGDLVAKRGQALLNVFDGGSRHALTYGFHLCLLGVVAGMRLRLCGRVPALVNV